MRRALPACSFWCLLLVVVTGCGDGGSSEMLPEPDEPIENTWRSVLFPSDWTPQTTDPDGRFLHDMSYAGYRGGQAPLPGGAGMPIVNAVAHHGADATGATDATGSIQSAIDAAALLGSAIVFLPEGLYRVDGLLTIQSSGIILRGAGAALSRIHFTRHSAMTGRAHLTVGTSPGTAAEVPLRQDAAPRQREVFVDDAQALRVGDDVVLGYVITPEFVDAHGMTGVWGPFNGTWQPFERREIVAIDMSTVPHRITVDVPLRYPALVRDRASLRVETGYLSEVGVEHLGVANAVGWDDAWANDRTHAIAFIGVKDGWVRDVASFSSPSAPASGPGAGAHLQNCGILTLRSKRVTVANTRLEKAQDRGGGGSGYLFELRQCNEVLTRDATAIAGRHNFIQNWGFGTSGCVWLRCRSEAGLALFSKDFPTIGQLGYSEFHHSLAMANLIDSCTILDGWSGINRGTFSSGAGHSATQNVFWNVQGAGVMRSQQFGWGYVIGTSAEVTLNLSAGSDTTPTDWVEGEARSADLVPQSLYLDQHNRRTGVAAEAATP